MVVATFRRMKKEGIVNQLGELVARGRTADVFAFGPGVVIKVPRSDVPSEWAAIEAEHSRAVHAQGLPTPKLLDLVLVEGRESIVFERIDGPSMWECMVAQPRETRRLAREMAAVHLEVLGSIAPTGLAPLSVRLGDNIDAVEALSPHQRHQASALAGALPGGDLLCHGDLHPGNILMSDRGPVVIDWFDAASGNAFADVVRTSLLIRPPVAGPVASSHLPGATVPILEQLHLAYLEAMFVDLTVDIDVVRRWEAVLAVSRLAERADSSDVDLVALWEAHEALHTAPTPLTDALTELALV